MKRGKKQLSTAAKKVILGKLYRFQRGKCRYCKRKVRLPQTVQDGISYVHADDTATIDHLYSRFDLRRYAVGGNHWKAMVCACRKCNGDRSFEEHRSINAMGLEAMQEIFDIRALIDTAFEQERDTAIETYRCGVYKIKRMPKGVR